MAFLRVLPRIPMSVYQRFAVINKAAVQKLASRTHPIKKSDFHCIGACGNVCSSIRLPHKVRGMCRNCYFLFYYRKSESAAQTTAGNAEPHADKATLRRWYAENGNNAREAARKNLPIGGVLHSLANRIMRAVKSA